MDNKRLDELIRFFNIDGCNINISNDGSIELAEALFELKNLREENILLKDKLNFIKKGYLNLADDIHKLEDWE